MSFQEHLTQVTALRQQALAQQHQQRQAIVAQWKPIVRQLLQALGENAWGKDRYTIIEPEQSATWAIVNFRGSKNSQFFIVLDFELVDIDAVLATGDSPPSQLAKAIGFRVIGATAFNADLSESELERALIAALQKGPDQELLPSEITKALSRFPYQADEYDQRSWWKSALMWLGGPVTVLIAVGGVIGSRTIITDSISNSTEQFIFPALLLATVSIVVLVAGIWATRVTDFGRRYNKLPFRQKSLATIAMLPGIYVCIAFSIAFVLRFFYWRHRRVLKHGNQRCARQYMTS